MTLGEQTRSRTAEAPHGLLETARAALARRRPDGHAWLEAGRAAAAAFVEAQGFPDQTVEAFRFTRVRDVTRVPYALGDAAGTDGALAAAAARNAASALPGSGVRVVFVDGRPTLPESAALPPGLEVRTLADVLIQEPGRLEPHLGRVAAVEDGFSALNAALWQDGIVVFAGAKARGRVELAFTASPGGGHTLALPRVLVVLGEASELTLVESFEGSASAVRGSHLSVPVTEIVVGARARVEHVRIFDGASAPGTLATVSVLQERDSHYASRVFTFGGSPSRLDLRVRLAGEGAECAMDGVYFAGDGELVDHHTQVDHARPHCSSRERYKGALDGTGTAVFDGTVLVRHGAFRTEAHQENRNLLLSADAVLHTKPHLRIDADDVKCSHGATVGRLDPAQLFYLRSRGMDATVARSLLTYAFLREMTAAAPEDLRPLLDERIAALFPDGAAAREFA